MQVTKRKKRLREERLVSSSCVLVVFFQMEAYVVVSAGQRGHPGLSEGYRSLSGLQPCWKITEQWPAVGCAPSLWHAAAQRTG